MTSNRRTAHIRFAAAAITLTAALGMAVASPLATSAAPSLNQLGSQLNQERSRQQGLSSSISGLSESIASLTGQITLVQSREAAVRTELARDEAALAQAKLDLAREKRRLVVLRQRLARARMLLSRQLVSSYEGDHPDLVAVVLDAHGFTDLLDRLTFLHYAEGQQQTIIGVTRAAKAQADAAARRLTALKASDQRMTDATALQSRALAGMNALLQSKQGALQQARSAQQAALSASQARSGALQAQITQIEQQQAAERAAAAAAAARAAAISAAASAGSSSGSSAATGSSGAPAVGGSGGWVIPGSVVQCESGGQNLPPNSAGASGYYQIMPATWRQYGGTGSAAYQASQAEQNAVAQRIWNGGSGASNWVCAGMVGIH
jgi:septal ring factor EnvC (AmiA/AmiB activator)